MLALNMNNVDEIQPAIVDIQNALNNFPNLPKNSECIEKINKWVTILKQKQASDSLSDTEIK